MEIRKFRSEYNLELIPASHDNVHFALRIERVRNFNG